MKLIIRSLQQDTSPRPHTRWGPPPSPCRPTPPSCPAPSAPPSRWPTQTVSRWLLIFVLIHVLEEADHLDILLHLPLEAAAAAVGADLANTEVMARLATVFSLSLAAAAFCEGCGQLRGCVHQVMLVKARPGHFLRPSCPLGLSWSSLYPISKDT